MTKAFSRASYSRVVLLHGIHGSEAVGSAHVVAHIKQFLSTHFPDLDIYELGPLSPWSAARGFRFDADLVDPNRVFACPKDDYKLADQLHLLHELWYTLMPIDEHGLLSFIDTCQLNNLSLQDLLSFPQPIYPGLPGFCRSPALSSYQSLVAKLVSNIISGLPIGSGILLVDVHLGIGAHARTTIHSDNQGNNNPLPHGSFISEICFRLCNEGYSPYAVVSETGCISNLHGLLSLFQELAHRCFSTSDVIVPLRPLVDSTWRNSLDKYLLGDLNDILSPLFSQVIACRPT